MTVLYTTIEHSIRILTLYNKAPCCPKPLAPKVDQPMLKHEKKTKKNHTFFQQFTVRLGNKLYDRVDSM